jgi:hypothetical protein
LPAPPLAMMGTRTRAATASSISRSKPCFTPSVSMELRHDLPRAVLRAPDGPLQRVAAGILAAALGEHAERAVHALYVHAESTTHWLPYFWAAAPMSAGSGWRRS